MYDLFIKLIVKAYVMKILSVINYLVNIHVEPAGTDVTVRWVKFVFHVFKFNVYKMKFKVAPQ